MAISHTLCFWWCRQFWGCKSRILWKVPLTGDLSDFLFSWLNWGCLFWGDHREQILSLSRRIEGSCSQQDLSLVMLTSINWLRSCWYDFPTLKSPPTPSILNSLEGCHWTHCSLGFMLQLLEGGRCCTSYFQLFCMWDSSASPDCLYSQSFIYRSMGSGIFILHGTWPGTSLPHSNGSYFGHWRFFPLIFVTFWYLLITACVYLWALSYLLSRRDEPGSS